jgi:hypothetical protein
MEDFDKKVRTADGQKKIFDNRVKYILFFLTVLTAVVALWDKCGSLAHKSPSETQNPTTTDSLSKLTKNQTERKETSLSSKRHHPGTAILQTPVNSGPPPVTAQRSKGPIQTAYSDNIEFKLMKAIGNSKTQTVTITIVLITNVANWHIWSDVHSIIDPEGNEYKTKSFTNGASAYDSKINLNTGVPIKCTYTFGGILPNVKNIALFKFEYGHGMLDDPTSVEFRDISIDWI